MWKSNISGIETSVIEISAANLVFNYRELNENKPRWLRQRPTTGNGNIAIYSTNLALSGCPSLTRLQIITCRHLNIKLSEIEHSGFNPDISMLSVIVPFRRLYFRFFLVGIPISGYEYFEFRWQFLITIVDTINYGRHSSSSAWLRTPVLSVRAAQVLSLSVCLIMLLFQ